MMLSENNETVIARVPNIVWLLSSTVVVLIKCPLPVGSWAAWLPEKTFPPNDTGIPPWDTSKTNGQMIRKEKKV